MQRFCVAALALCLIVVSSGAASAQTQRSLNPQKTGEITGIVSYCGSQGVAGVSVHIPGESFQAQVAATGKFTLRYVPVGSYTLVVEIPGQVAHRIPTVAVADNKVTDLGTITVCRDGDGDGSLENVDCNDNNPAVHPNRTELCDGVDNNCNHAVDEGCALCTDADHDGFYAQAGCGTVVDCDDTRATRSPVVSEVCDSLDNDCDGVVDEGFDLSSDESNCGACDNACSFAHAGAACVSGVCEPGACLPAYADCDANAVNGCETPLASVANCGACGVSCEAGQTCSTGVCVTPQCDAGFASCDGNPGCETNLNSSLANCGACGQVCNLANASEACNAGACTLGACDSGFLNCDSNVANGCEQRLSGASNVSPGEFLGTYDADSASGFGCTNDACTPVVSRTGMRGRFFSVTAHEDSVCTAYIGLRVALSVPAGVDYDLHVSGGALCQGSDGVVRNNGCSSVRGSGATEIIEMWSNDNSGSLEDFTALIEVRFSGGASCQPWTLTVSKGGC